MASAGLKQSAVCRSNGLSPGTCHMVDVVGILFPSEFLWVRVDNRVVTIRLPRFRLRPLTTLLEICAARDRHLTLQRFAKIYDRFDFVTGE